ncbi:hypothetical protein Q9Q75_08920 [Mycobacterium intracellulare]|uniref:hypothetical protein n=1 Tax=Mycobacterium intracellulare TaxID=1767 RepID=UPI00334E97F8
MTTADHQHDSLVAALRKARIPAANHEFIRWLTSAIGVVEYRAQAVESNKPYVLATRRDGLPALHIYSGYTTGFTSENEIVSSVGVMGVPESRRKGRWYVEHPENRVRTGGEHSRDARREGGICGSCRTQLPMTGVCDNCD